MLSRLLQFTLKDIRWHWPTLLALGIALPLMFALQLAGAAINPDTVTALEAHRHFVSVLVPIAALVLANRLVVAEYYGRTQLFLEALPIHRFEPLIVKFVLGLVLLLFASGASLFLSALVAHRTEPVGARFIALIATRSALFIAFAWSGLFAMGLLGRMRVPIYALVFAAIGVLVTTTDFELSHFAPFALIGPRLVLERTAAPLREMAWTGGFVLAWLLLSVTLVSVGEGSLTESLSRPMSARERVTVGVIFAVWAMAQGHLSDRRTKSPLRFEGAAVLRSQVAPIEVQYARPACRDRAAELMSGLESDLVPLRSALGWTTLPPIRVALRESLDGATFEPVELHTADGVLVRANFMAPEGYDPVALRAAVIGRVLDHVSFERTRFESQRWLRDGFARWWVCQHHVGGCTGSSRRAALASAQAGTRADTLLRWTPTREMLGEPLSEALAWSVLDTLASVRSPADVHRLARRVFGRVPARDIREVFHARFHPIESEVTTGAGIGFEPLVNAWSARVANWRADAAIRADIGPLEATRVAFEIAPGIGRRRTLRYRVTGIPEAITRASFVHLDRGPFERPILESDLQRDEFTRNTDGTFDMAVSGRYEREARVYAAVEFDARSLGCLVRLGARRIELQ